MHNNDFEEIRKKVNRYFDHDMNQDDAENFLKEVDQNKHYRLEFDRERNMRENIKARVRRPVVSENTIQNILNKIRH